jgi:hypothetical protein
MVLTLQRLLKDRVVLYIVLFFAVTNVIGYLILHNLEAVLFFIVVGMLTTYFTQNMIVVLLTALIATNTIVGAQRAGAAKEGFVEGKHDEDDEERKKKKKEKEKDKKEKDKKEKGKGLLGSLTAKKPDHDDKTKKKKSEGMAGGRDGPAPASAAEDEEEAGGKPQIDYAATLESAYDNLDKLLGSDALAAMGNDTQRLAEKQNVLMGNLQKLEPMIQKAGSMLEGLEASGGAVGTLMEKFSSLGSLGGGK